MKTSERETRRIDALNALSHYQIKIGETLHITTDYVGNVGTAQSRVFIIRDGDLVNITALVAWAMGDTPKERKGDGRWVIVTKGMGYSRAQHITQNLEYALRGTKTLKYSEF